MIEITPDVNMPLQCALGVHRFDKEVRKNYFLCSICERAKYHKDASGFEYWYKLNGRGDVVYCKISNDYEYWKEYDEKGNEIRYRTNSGFEQWYEYDEQGNVIHSGNNGKKWGETSHRACMLNSFSPGCCNCHSHASSDPGFDSSLRG